MTKLHFVFDLTKKSKKLKKNILKRNKNFPVAKSEVIVVAGGDGFMLKTMKKYYLSTSNKQLPKNSIRHCR